MAACFNEFTLAAWKLKDAATGSWFSYSILQLITFPQIKILRLHCTTRGCISDQHGNEYFLIVSRRAAIKSTSHLSSQGASLGRISITKLSRPAARHGHDMGKQQKKKKSAKGTAGTLLWYTLRDEVDCSSQRVAEWAWVCPSSQSQCCWRPSRNICFARCN